MAHNTSLSLGDHFAAFINSRLETGRYSSASEVVRAGLRLLEEQEVRLDALRNALIEGENSGAAAEFDFGAFLAQKKRA